MKIEEDTDLLLIVDVQNDFVTGSLAVPGAKDIISVINRYIKRFKHIFLSRDMHPVNHCSFVAQGGPWPPHCVADTDGTKLYSGLDVPKDLSIVDKGISIDKDAYSAFEATQLLEGTLLHASIIYIDTIIDKLDLSAHLRSMGIKRLFVCGLATEYCVKATVLDAAKKFDGPVFLLLDAIKAVKADHENMGKAIYEMTKSNAIPITLIT